MNKIPDGIDIELVKIWLASQDLSGKTPEETKEMFFDALHRMEQVKPERWD